MKLDVALTRLAAAPSGGLVTVLARSLACLAPLVVLRLLLLPVMAPASGMTIFIPAVLMAALWSGWRAGVLTSMLGAAVSTGLYLVAQPLADFDMERYLLSILLFGLNASFAVPFGVYLRAAFRRLGEASEALKSSELRFRQLVEQAPVMLWMGDPQGGCVHLNRALRAFWGVGDDLSVFEWSATVHPEDQERLWSVAGPATARGEAFEAEARYRRADGTWRLMATHAQPRYAPDGAYEGMTGVNIDVTDAREAEAALRESEQRFREMADSAPAPVWVSTPDGGVEFGNRAMIDFFGGDPDAVLGMGWAERTHPDDLPTVLAAREAGRAAGAPFDFEARFLAAEGRWRRMRVATTPRIDATGRLTGYVGIAFDVTEAREATEALAAQERRQAFLLELGDRLSDLESPAEIMAEAARLLGAQLGVARAGYGEVAEDETHVSIGGDWTDGSVASAEGRYEMDDFGPDLARDLRARRTVAVADVDTDDRTRDSAPAFRTNQVRAFVRVPIVRGGRLRAFLFVHAPERRDWTPAEIELAQDVAGRVWTAVERARAEIELKESEARFRSIADMAPVLIWVTRADRRRAFVNRAYVEFMGSDYEAALTADWREALHPDDIDRLIAESLAGEASGEPFMLEARYRRHDGLYRWLRSYSRPRFDAEGQLLGFVGVAYDVSEAKKVQDDLININELLEARVAEALAEKDRAEAALMHAQRMEAVGRLTGGVAHDFNNLLTVVIGALDMVSRGSDDAERRDRLIQAALAAARRGERLTHQLLAFSRRQTLRPQVSDLNRLIAEGEPLLRRAVGEAVRLDLSLEPGLAPVSIDPAHFEAALLNLIVNARDAVNDGGRIEVSARSARLATGEREGAAEGDYVLIQVRDDGAGMPPEVRERVFEPFFTTKAVGKGTGLGLSQVYGFVRQSGGAIDIDSASGEGTTVSLWLPAVAEPVAEAPEQSAAPLDLEDRPFEGVRVLLAEDEADVASVCGEMLAAFGMKVTRAADAAQALAALDFPGGAFDLLLTDLIMPGGMNGVELARQATARRPGLRVLLASGYAGEAVEQALADAPWPLLSKPYDADSLRRALVESLARSPEPA